MAMKAGGEGELNSEINVTPMVDVMLVLLVIFMITAPLLAPTVVDMQLPPAKGKQVNDPKGKLVLALYKDDTVWLGVRTEKDATRVSWRELEAKLRTNEKIKADGALFVAAESTLLYGRVVTAMAIAQRAGIPKVLFLTSPNQELDLAELDKNAGK
jgi:biopolymer transport protein ExbD